MNSSKTLLCALVLACCSSVASAATLNGGVTVTGWSGSFVGWAPPSVGGGGGVNNDISQSNSNAYGGGSIGSQDYSVAHASGSATSEVKLATDTAPSTATATATLDLDVAGEPIGRTANGLTSAGFGGITYDVADFTVDFTIGFDASGSGPQSSGLFGVWVDAYSYNSVTGVKTDLLLLAETETDSDLLDGTNHLNYVAKTPGGSDYAWFFDYAIFDNAVTNGVLFDDVSVTFKFQSANGWGAGIWDVVDISAFAVGEVSAVPLPTSVVLFGSALAGLGFFGSRRRRGAAV